MTAFLFSLIMSALFSRSLFIVLFSTIGLKAAGPGALFDGKSLDGWEGTPGLWRVEDGAITGEIKAGAQLNSNEWIFWKGDVRDFEVDLEYRVSGGPSANSGVQIRSQRDAKGMASGLQCDLDDGKEWLGRIYDEHGRALVMERGTRVSIAPDGRRLNYGELVAGERPLCEDIDDPYRVGHMALSMMA